MIEDVFRKHEPSQVLHLGRVGNLKTRAKKRFDLNVMGSAKIMELSLKYAVERLIVLSTFHIYGAHQHNHIPIFEEEPLRAGQNFPQLADAVQSDNQAAMWTYRHRKIKITVLRPCNVVGPHIQNAISNYMRQPLVTYMLGYSPMWQFIHEQDMVDALLLALNKGTPGIFNVAGSGEIPLLDALKLTGARLFPVPTFLARAVLKAGRSRTIPPYFLDFLRYPCVISDAKFKAEFGFTAKVGLIETLRSTVNHRVLKEQT